MRTIIARVLAATLAAITIFSGGCTGVDRPTWFSVYPNNWFNRSVTDEPTLHEVAGPVEIEVENFNGDVVIEGNAELTVARVTVVREAEHGRGRIEEAIASLDEITYHSEIVPAELGHRLRVIATTTHAESHFQRADIYIEAPDIENVKVHTANGRVWVRNIRGSVDIATNEDDVRVMTNQTMNRAVTIVNRNGDIDFRIRGESQGLIDAETVNGRAHGFARFGRLIIDPSTRHNAFRAQFNGGSNLITLRTVNGDITVAIVHNPEQVHINLPD